MEDKKVTEHLSSWIVNQWALLFWFLFFVIALLFDRLLLSGFFLVIFFIAGFSRLWSKYSLNKTCINVTSSTYRLFPGQEITLNFEFENNKLWPLIWVQFLLPLSKNNAVLPQEGEDIYTVSLGQDEYASFYMNRVAWVLWFQNVKWQSKWKGVKRGFYKISSVVLSSGDGFGLAAVEKTQSLSTPLIIIVYPKLVPVDISGFKSIWGEKMGIDGIVEDATLLKTTRDYRQGDSWKHINWRLAALNKPLQVNVYEKVTYETIHFYLDAKSFENKNQEFEDTLSILASLIVELEQKNVSVALTLPSSTNLPKQHYIQRADSESLHDILKALSMIVLEECNELVLDEHDLLRDKSSEQIYWIQYNCSKNIIYEEFVKNIHAFLYYDDRDYNYNAFNNTRPYSIPLKSLKL